MNASEPGLFDLPDPEVPRRSKRPPRGRNRETWARTASAEVTIVDAQALREELARMDENGVTVGLVTGPDVEDAMAQTPRVPAGIDALDAVAWLTWPIDGLEPLLEADAFRVLSAGSEVVAESEDRGTLVWTVTVKLTDADALRRAATRAHPQEAGLIEESLTIAWERAADAFAPLRSIPGITWKPLHVDVQHLPRRATRNR